MKKLSFVVTLILATGGYGAWADEILPAAAATEDLKNFDQSVVVPAAINPVAAEAQKLRQEGRKEQRLKGVKPGQAGPREGGGSNAVRNSKKRNPGRRN